jgi:hypothetical protein
MKFLKCFFAVIFLISVDTHGQEYELNEGWKCTNIKMLEVINENP